MYLFIFINTKSFLLSNECVHLTQVACETFCLDDDDTILEATLALRSPTISSSTVRFVEAKQESLAKGTLVRVVHFRNSWLYCKLHKPYVHFLLIAILQLHMCSVTSALCTSYIC